MAATEFGSASDQAVKRWSEKLMKETLGKMGMRGLIGTHDDSCIQLKTELKKSAGDQIKCDLLVQDRSDGVNGDTRQKGAETPLSFYQDTLLINQKRNAHVFRGMSQQRTLHNLRTAGRGSLSTWWAWFIEAGLMAHLVGVSGDGEETVIGALGATTGESDFAGNTVTALDAAHLVDGSGAAMVLSLIDDAVSKAKVNNPRAAPIMIEGEMKYVAYLHPYQTRALRVDAGAGQWNQIQQNAGVRGKKNLIYSGAVGEYNNVIIRESEFVPSVGTLRHGMLLGACAGAIAFGNAWSTSSRSASGGGSFFDWKEEEDDYGNEKGVAGVSILGFKRSIWNSKAFGVIGIDSTDAAP